MGKRKAEDDGGEAGPSTSSKKASGALVNPARWKELNKSKVGSGPVIYW